MDQIRAPQIPRRYTLSLARAADLRQELEENRATGPDSYRLTNQVPRSEILPQSPADASGRHQLRYSRRGGTCRRRRGHWKLDLFMDGQQRKRFLLSRSHVHRKLYSMEHVQDKQCLDFWPSLVDSRGATENSKPIRKNHSFTMMDSSNFESSESQQHRPHSLLKPY